MKEGSVKFVGVDVAKDHLELFSPGLKLPTRLNNNPKTIAVWLRRLLVSCPTIHVVCESTGGCENALLRAPQPCKRTAVIAEHIDASEKTPGRMSSRNNQTSPRLVCASA